MNHRLTKDEFNALGQISKNPRSARSSACVARNAKRLAGLKYLAYGKDNSLTLTEKGQQTLFIQSCIDGLRAVAADPLAKLEAGVVTFLGKKGYISAALPDRFDITPRGRECLADIDATGAQD
ncbi:hypothetical protein [Herminiimonas sp. CN]|uniref:hypothetical protein n=1 Tax=Herminiimonas sp. CN TaxID=1349818 RepID=UPI000473C821|nr:hypothetical protein [Herminiimonas sp. CN]